MSTQLEALGIAVRSPYAADERAGGRRPGGDRQRALARQPRGGGRPRPQAAHDQPARAAGRGVPARAHARWWWPGPTARPRPPACSPSCSTAAGLDPSFLIGGVPARLRAQLPAGRRARTSWSRATSTTARSSTSGPKFVHYLPDVAVIGNVEYDHADIYPDLAAVQTAFVRLLQRHPAARAAGGRASRARRSREILPRALLPGRDVRARRGSGLARRGRAAARPAARASGSCAAARDLGEFELAPRRRAQRAQRAGRAGRRRRGGCRAGARARGARRASAA